MCIEINTFTILQVDLPNLYTQYVGAGNSLVGVTNLHINLNKGNVLYLLNLSLKSNNVKQKDKLHNKITYL